MPGYPSTIYILPEDDRDRQLARGFQQHDQVDPRRIKVMPPSGGWAHVLREFEKTYISRLRLYPADFIVLVIDFDGTYAARYAKFTASIPTDLVGRVFVIGARETPEELRKSMGISFEKIGQALAEDCFHRASVTWDHAHLKHNQPDCAVMSTTVRSILFP